MYLYGVPERFTVYRVCIGGKEQAGGNNGARTAAVIIGLACALACQTDPRSIGRCRYGTMAFAPGETLDMRAQFYRSHSKILAKSTTLRLCAFHVSDFLLTGFLVLPVLLFVILLKPLVNHPEMFEMEKVNMTLYMLTSDMEIASACNR